MIKKIIRALSLSAAIFSFISLVVDAQDIQAKKKILLSSLISLKRIDYNPNGGQRARKHVCVIYGRDELMKLLTASGTVNNESASSMIDNLTQARAFDAAMQGINAEPFCSSAICTTLCRARPKTREAQPLSKYIQRTNYPSRTHS